MSALARALLCGALLALAGAAGACGGAAKKLDLPSAVETKTIGPDDAFELRIVGEDKLPTGYTVAPDGTVELPYVKRVKVAGLEPQQLEELVRTKLMEGKFLTDPTVMVSVKEYRSKKVEVLGEVNKPSSLPLEPGMTLLRAISQAGGFNTIANKDRVTIRRKQRDGTTRASTISVDDITSNRTPDVVLQAGDTVYVAQRVF